jgi:DNA-directed RNA polymerase specialized sigma24 family protein
MIESQFSENRVQRFKVAYDLYYSLIFSTIFSKVHNYDEAEDLCQELFSRFFMKIEEIENPKAWLYGAMRIIMIEHYKSKGEKTENIESLLDDEGTSYINGFREARLVIQDVISDPSSFDEESDRVIFELVAKYCFSIADASRHLGMTYRQTHYSFEQSSKKIINGLKSKGIKKLEDLL